MTEDWAPPNDIDFTTPNVARMYDYYLGGKDHYAADREAAEHVLTSAPEVRPAVQGNREFLQRAVRFLAAEAGIRQFIDIGTGLPNQKSVHEVSREVAPDARVVYVDNDPVVINHGLDLLTGVDGVTIIEADMRRPGEILNHPQLRKLINFDQPVAVLLLLMLHFLADDENPAGIVARLWEAMAPGSYLVLSHGTADALRKEAASEVVQTYTRATSSMTLRSRQEVEGFFDGFELLEPGVVFLPEWRPEPPDAETRPPGWAWGLAGVGRKP